MIGRRCKGSNVLSRPVLIAQNLSDSAKTSRSYLSQSLYCGGYSSVDPPLPIPNREVKHTNADGTDLPVGRVGSRRFSGVPMTEMLSGLFFCGLLGRLCLRDVTGFCKGRQGRGQGRHFRAERGFSPCRVCPHRGCFSSIHPDNRICGSRATAPATDSPTSNLHAQINVSLAQVQSLCRTPIHPYRRMDPKMLFFCGEILQGGGEGNCRGDVPDAGAAQG